MTGLSMFEQTVRNELRHARIKHSNFPSYHHGYAVILEEVDELKAEVWKQTDQYDKSKMYAECVQIAAMAQRFAEDLL